MSPIANKIREFFEADSLLSQKISGYAPRAAQLEMSLAVNNALEKNEVLIVEAGTGTGKTFAYLVPSLLSNKKIIVSTGTKNLQDQLYHRDVPLIRKALSVPINVAILKGRSNYLCLHRLNTYLHTDLSDEMNREINHIRSWSKTTDTGEIEHVPHMSQDTTVWPYVTSTADNCLGQDCEFFSQCFVLKARRLAQEADLLIINHHLFFADNHLRDTGFGELLPHVDGIVFDEAHQLPEIASHFLGETISSRQFTYLGKDIESQQQIDAPDMLELKWQATHLQKATKKMKDAFGYQQKGSWEKIIHKPEIQIAIANLSQVLSALQKLLEVAAPRSRGLENCWRRACDLNQKFARLTTTDSENQIHWYEVLDFAFSIHHSPMDISAYFQTLIKSEQRTWIFTSATLSVSGNFSHFVKQLGLQDTSSIQLDSPFNFRQQALLYIPKIYSEPQDQHYTQDIVSAALPLLTLTSGKTFFLFTSHKALKEAAHLLSDKIAYPLLVQNSLPKSKLLELFYTQENAILLGTSSFWEGVDVKGSGLNCVIIDKIPFTAPDDPILKARMEFLKKRGDNPFLEYQLPQAVITLRQGAGRLIRDIHDKGILMICDPRLLNKEYGELFLKSLPAMPLTRQLETIADFFKRSDDSRA